MPWRASAREPRHRQVEAAPEKMYGAALTDKARAECLEHAIGLQEHPPEALRIFGIIRGMHPILAEADRVRQLVGNLIDVHLHANIGERSHDRRMEIRHRL